jgi:hypothetical protein
MQITSRALITAGLGAVLSLSFAPSALAEVSNVSVGNGTLQAKGLGVSVPVSFVCDAGTHYDFQLYLRQSVQKTVTISYSSGFGACTGHTQRLVVQGRPEPKPFKKGMTLADFGLSSCGNRCTSTSLTKIIKVR